MPARRGFPPRTRDGRDRPAEVVLEHSGTGTILACSHQPGLSYALSDLTGCGTIGFRRPGAAVMRFELPRVGMGEIIAVLPPRVLRAAAPPRS